VEGTYKGNMITAEDFKRILEHSESDRALFSDQYQYFNIAPQKMYHKKKKERKKTFK
jgi:hypothetical protein